MFCKTNNYFLLLRTDERITEAPQMLGGIAVDVAHIFITEVELVGIGNVYGEVV